MRARDIEMTDHQQQQQDTLLVSEHATNNDNGEPTSEEIAALGEEAATERHMDISKIVAADGMTVCGRHFTTKETFLLNVVVVVVASLALGLGITSPKDNPAYKVVSATIGWMYFLIWSLSFLPQLFLNHKRKSVIGQNASYLVLNVLGFTVYTIYNFCFFFSKEVKDEYKVRFGSNEQVQPNDVAFAVFALVATLYNCWQYVPSLSGYERGAQTVERPIRIFIVVSVIVASIWGIALAAGARTTYFFQPLDLLYGLGVIKLAVTVIKYVPQILLSYRRKTTIGWNVWNVMMDLSGGVLSLAQEIMDAGETGDWNAMVGNPIKFGLGFFSVVYDIVMLVQHFCLYDENNKKLIDEYHRKCSPAQETAAAAE